MTSMMSPVDLMPKGMEHNNVVLVAVTSIFTSLSTVAVVLRFISRRISMSFKWDDWFTLIALIFAWGCFIVTILDATIGHGGYDVEYYSAATLEKYLSITLADNMMYNMSISFSKAAVLLFYQRIFNIKKPFRIASWIIGFLIAGDFIASQCVLIFAFDPVQAQWKPWIPHSKNFDIIPCWVAMSSVHTVMDLVLLLLPQPLVWSLNMSRKKKVLVSGLFCFGILICIAGLLHIIWVSKVDMNNPTGTQSVTGTWQNVELNMSVIITCLPTFPSLIDYLRKRRRNTSGPYGKSHDEMYRASPHNSDLPDSGSRTRFAAGSKGEQTSEREQESVNQAGHDFSYQMEHLGPVHVQTDFIVKWDQESHRSAGLIV